MQQCGLVHRDVKSTNILLRPCTEDPTKMVVKIADLGAPPVIGSHIKSMLSSPL